jgi:hypothetical protein
MRRDRHPPQARHRSAGLPVLPQRMAGGAGRGGLRLRRGPRPARRHDRRIGRTRHRGRCRQRHHVQMHRLRRRSGGQYRECDDRPLPLVPARLRRQRAGGERRGARCGVALPHQEGRRSRAHPPVRGQTAPVRAEGIQGTVHARERRRRVPAVHDRRRQGERRRLAGSGRDRDGGAIPAAAATRRRPTTTPTSIRSSATSISPSTTCRWNLPANAASSTPASIPTTSSTRSFRSTPRTR